MENKNIVKKAFTLIELLIVIAIIGILASAVVLSIGDSTGAARDAKNTQVLSGIRTVAQLHFATTTSYDDLCINTAISEDFYGAVDDTGETVTPQVTIAVVRLTRILMVLRFGLGIRQLNRYCVS